MQRALYFSILASLGFLFLFQNVFATPPIKESKNIEMNLTLSSEPELNKEFTVTFTFKPLEDIPHISELDDQAEIAFDEGIQLVGGQAHWDGKLKDGQEITIQAVLKPITEGVHTIHGNVGSCQIDPRFIGEDPLLKMKTGMKYYGKVFRFHNGTVKQFKIGEAKREIEGYSIDLKTGEINKIKMDGYSPPPFGRPATIAKEQIPMESKSQLNNRSPMGSVEKEYGIPLISTQETSDSIKANKILEINLCKGASVIVFLYEKQDGRVAKAQWRCEPSNGCKIEMFPNDKVRVTSLSSQGVYFIIGSYKGYEYRVEVHNSATSYLISGHFQYVDNYGYSNDMKEMLVSSQYKSGSTWIVETWTHTNNNGYFEVYTTGHDTMRFMAWSYHAADFDSAGYVFKTDGHLDGGDQIWLYLFGALVANVYQNYQIPDAYLTCNYTSHTGAYDITNAISKGYYRVEDVVGWWYRPPFSYTYWDNADGGDSTMYTKRITVGGIGVMIIQGQAMQGNGERDQWDWGVILHEYGHFIMDSYAQFPPINSGYTHVYYLPASIVPT